jgi:glyoxylate reductase
MDGLCLTPSDRVDAELLDAVGPQLAIVANHAVGYDNVDLASATERGVLVSNTPGVLTRATAEFTIALLLSLVRRVTEGDRCVRTGRPWILAPGFMLGSGLGGRTLGIVGLGRIGREVAALAEAFGMRVVYTNRRRSPTRRIPGSGSRLLSTVDVVSLLPVDARHPSPDRRPRALPRPATRGAREHDPRPVVDEAALVARSPRALAGAALDVRA